MAQTPEAVPGFIQPAIAQPSTDSNFVENFLNDHKDLWLSPFKVKGKDAKWMVPLALGAAGFLAVDGAISDKVSGFEGGHSTSRVFSKMGGSAPMGLASAAMWGIGTATKNEKAAQTGKLAVKAVMHSTLVAAGMKAIFNRERPNKIDGQGSFWGSGESFPSGHAMTTFAFATVVADQYKDKPLVAIGAYGLATAVTLSRLNGKHHFPSDLLVGAAVGHLIGRFVLNRDKEDEVYVPEGFIIQK